MKLVNVVGDSLSMVRQTEGIFLEDLYWYKLQELLGNSYYVVNHSRRANTTSIIVANEDDDILGRKADVLIIFIGIVDCFPRLFTKKEHAFLSLLPKLRLNLISHIIIRVASKHRYTLTKRFRKVFVTPVEFEGNLRRLLGLVHDQQAASFVYLMGIVETNDQTRASTYGIDDHIIRYNQIMRNLAVELKSGVKFLDTSVLLREKGIQEAVLSDGHHLTKEAHTCLARVLCQEINGDYE